MSNIIKFSKESKNFSEFTDSYIEYLSEVFSKVSKNKLFYDIIYNPSITNFLKIGQKLGNKIVNGKLMFIYQAAAAFNIWHNINPKINDEVIKLLDND